MNLPSDGVFYTDTLTPSDAILEDVQSSSASGAPYYRPEESDAIEITPTQETLNEQSAPEHGQTHDLPWCEHKRTLSRRQLGGV